MCERYIWKIENFSCLKSGTVQSLNFNRYILEINPFFSSEYIGIEIKPNLMSYFAFSSKSYFSIALLDSEGSPLLWREKKDYCGILPIVFCDIERGAVFDSMRTKFLPDDILRLQVLVWNGYDIRDSISSLFKCSRIELEQEVIEKTFHWDIPNSSREPRQVRETFQTSECELFTSEGEAKLLTSRGDTVAIRLFFGTALRVKLTASLEKVHVKCIISMLDAKKKIELTNTGFYFRSEHQEWTFNIPITKNLLRYYRNVFVPYNKLSLVFDCTFSINKIGDRELLVDELFFNNTVQDGASADAAEPEHKKRKQYNGTISEDLKSVLEENVLSDFSFRVQDKIFPVHKIILSARSSVFKAMFTIQMKEKDSGSVDIPDVEGDTFQRMLDFIYSDSVEDDMQWESASKLYSVADKYALEPLKQKCSGILKTGLCVSNVLDVLLLGDTHQDDDLKDAALDFVAKNDKQIVGTDLWSKFMEEHPKLALGCITKLYARKMNG